jgi:arylsulfatase A-like enzyme
VPFVAAGAGIARGAKSDAPVSSIDLPATWMDFAGVKPMYKLAGRNLASLLKTGKGGPEAGFSVWADGRPEALTVNQAVERRTGGRVQRLGRRAAGSTDGKSGRAALPPRPHAKSQTNRLGITERSSL